MNREAALFRSRLNREVRNFFDSRSYLEVETPTLSPTLIPEAHIENFAAHYHGDTLGERELYLIPSPELHMKRLIAEGSGSIYQIGRCYRNDEQLSRYHNPEFTMLEWYTVPGSSEENITLTEELFAALASVLPGGTGLPGSDTLPRGKADTQLCPPFRRISMAEAFREFADVDLEKCLSTGVLREEAARIGMQPRSNPESWEELFHRIFLTLVEPELPTDRPLILYQYPAAIPALAERIPGTPWRDRWELYVKGVEIANCYGEERNRRLVEAFFRQEAAMKAQYARVIPDTDPGFPALFDDFPQCSGVALGMDRLAMLFSGCDTIGGVILFPFSDMLL